MPKRKSAYFVQYKGSKKRTADAVLFRLEKLFAVSKIVATFATATAATQKD